MASSLVSYIVVAINLLSSLSADSSTSRLIMFDFDILDLFLFTLLTTYYTTDCTYCIIIIIIIIIIFIKLYLLIKI